MSKTELCETFDHDWKEDYYGCQCSRCPAFYAYGCAPWEWNPDDDDNEDDEFPSEASGYSSTCPDCLLPDFNCDCGEPPPEAGHDADCPCCSEFRNDE